MFTNKLIKVMQPPNMNYNIYDKKNYKLLNEGNYTKLYKNPTEFITLSENVLRPCNAKSK